MVKEIKKGEHPPLSKDILVISFVAQQLQGMLEKKEKTKSKPKK